MAFTDKCLSARDEKLDVKGLTAKLEKLAFTDKCLSARVENKLDA